MKTPTLRPASTGSPVRRWDRAAEAGAVAAAAAFAGGALLTQVVTVPRWRQLEPGTFLSDFATSGPATGAVLFPTEMASVLLLGYAVATQWRHRRPGRRLWALATASMVGTLVLLPAYFAGANASLLDPAFPLEAVAGELASWYRWNWLRTGLALTATALGVAALATADPPTTRRAGGTA